MYTPTSLTRLYLVRHGETAWSLTGQHTGRTDIPLTEHGEEQARVLGEQLHGATFARVFTSPLLRARQTCEQIGWGPVMEIEPDLVEWDYGQYDGLRLVEIHKIRPDWNIYQHGCPGGETPTQVCGRVDRLLARLRSLQGNIAIVCHGHLGRVLGARWTGLPIERAKGLVLDTATVSVLGYEHDHPAIALWNAKGI